MQDRVRATAVATLRCERAARILAGWVGSDVLDLKGAQIVRRDEPEERIGTAYEVLADVWGRYLAFVQDVLQRADELTDSAVFREVAYRAADLPVPPRRQGASRRHLNRTMTS